MPATPPQLMANGNIGMCRFVMMDPAAAHKGLQATANARLIGISYEGSNYPPLSDIITTHYAAQVGESFRLYGDGEICLLEAGEVLATDGLRLKSDAVGRGVAIATVGTTKQEVGAVNLQPAGAVGAKILVVVQCHAEQP